jgi:tRNA dimethylallyltransferase
MKGLDIVTNKVTQEEAENIPHHLIGILPVDHQTFNVSQYVSQALNIVIHFLSFSFLFFKKLKI